MIRAGRHEVDDDVSKGGGVGLYVKHICDNLKTSVILTSVDTSNFPHIDSLYVEIYTRNLKIVVGVVYRAPKCLAAEKRQFTWRFQYKFPTR